jgi:hypothetical protein
VRTVAGRLGHADPSVTLRVYAHGLEARDRELAGMLGSAVVTSLLRHALVSLHWSTSFRPGPPLWGLHPLGPRWRNLQRVARAESGATPLRRRG